MQVLRGSSALLSVLLGFSDCSMQFEQAVLSISRDKTPG